MLQKIGAPSRVLGTKHLKCKILNDGYNPDPVGKFLILMSYTTFSVLSAPVGTAVKDQCVGLTRSTSLPTNSH